MTIGTRGLGSCSAPSAGRRARRRTRGVLAAAALVVLDSLAASPAAQARPALTHAPRPAATVTTSVRHRIAKGENLYRIALSYGVTVADLCRANGIKDADLVAAGRVLFVPVTRPSHRAGSAGRGGRTATSPRILMASTVESRFRPSAGRPSTRTSPTSVAPTASAPDMPKVKGSTTRPESRAEAVIDDMHDSMPADSAASFDEARETSDPEGVSEGDGGPHGISFRLIPSGEPFSWPVQGGIVRSPFGMRHGRQHAGIDIGAPSGSPIYAARDGTVAYSGHKHRGYGNVVMIDHGDGFLTVYAHNVANLVHEGDPVVRGQMIARVGATGNATGAHCHFEIRNDNISANPRGYLSESPEDDLVFAKITPPGSALPLKQAGAAATADMIP